MKVWIARDEEGSITISKGEDNYIYLPSNHPLGEGITIDSPREITLVDAKNQAHELAVLREMVELFSDELFDVHTSYGNTPLVSKQKFQTLVKDEARTKAEQNIKSRSQEAAGE